MLAIGAVQYRFHWLGASSAAMNLLLGAGALGLIVGYALITAPRPPHACQRRVRPKHALRSIFVRGSFAAVPALITCGVYAGLPHYALPEYRAFIRHAPFLLLIYSVGPFLYYFLIFCSGRGVHFDPGDKALVLLAFVRRFRPCRHLSLRRIGKNNRLRTAVLSIPLRAFFLPLMVSSVAGLLAQIEMEAVLAADAWRSASFDAFCFRSALPLASKSVLLLDVFIAAVAYSVEFRWLGNRIRSVDSTLAGWLVCLLCYFPFEPLWSQIAGDWLAGAPSLPALGSRSDVDRVRDAAILLMQVLWLLPTLSLGLRASNLTNRGIVDFGPYRWVRHPQYAARMLWMLVDVLTKSAPTRILAIALIIFALYIARCLTEERHLRSDPEYRAYAARVRYRLLPGVW